VRREDFVAIFPRGRNAGKNVLQLPRRNALDLTLVNDDAELFLLGQIADALKHGNPESGHVAREDVVHVEVRGGVKQRVVQRVLDGVWRGYEIEHEANRVFDVIVKRRAGVN